jgi:hypothetical protein
MPAISWFDFLEFSQLQWKNDLKKMNLEECRRERSWYRAYFKISYDGVRLISQNCGLYCSSPGDCDVDHGMMESIEANS